MECLNMHQDAFRHLDPKNRDLLDYDLGIKFRYDETLVGVLAEPRLYLYVSVLELSTERDLGILYYAQPCTYLRYKLKGRAPETADEESLKMAVLRRLAADLKAQRSGDIPESSEEQPIFIRHTS